MIIRRIVSSCVTAVLLATSIASAQTVTDFPSQTQSDQTYTPSAIEHFFEQYMDSLRDSDSQDDHTYTPSASENFLTHQQYMDSLRRLNTQNDHTYRVMHDLPIYNSGGVVSTPAPEPPADGYNPPPTPEP